MRDIMAGVDEKDRGCLLIYKPLVFDSHLSGVCLAGMSRPMVFLGDDFGNGFRMLLLGSTVVTCSASVYGCFWKTFIFST